LISYHCGQKAMPVVGHKCSTLPLHYLVSFVLCSSRKNLLVSVEFGKMINKLLEVSTMSEYPSNISREQFELIRPDLEGLRKHTRPCRYDLYDVFNAILCSLRTCLVSFKNYLQEGQYNHLKTAVKGTFTVFPKSPTFV